MVAVSINDPKGEEYYGGLVAAPVFAEIMKTGLRLLNVPADQLNRTLADVTGAETTTGAAHVNE